VVTFPVLLRPQRPEIDLRREQVDRGVEVYQAGLEASNPLPMVIDQTSHFGAFGQEACDNDWFRHDALPSLETARLWQRRSGMAWGGCYIMPVLRGLIEQLQQEPEGAKASC
jgi:hypothetical protein